MCYNLIIFKKIIFLFCFFINICLCDQKIIMINPAGHAKETGRKLTRGFERGETYKCAQQIAHMLQERYCVKAILTRELGEELVHLQSASFANRLNTFCFLSVHIYKEITEKPKIYFYHLVYDPVGDFATRNYNPQSFVPVAHAHLINISLTREWAKKIKENLSAGENQTQFDFYGVYGIPVKPLVGVIAPAFLCEIGLSEDNKWESLLDSIVNSLSFLRG
jgi:N-acetylmuramoyl-L-alanine amidase